ncbi:HSF5 protein, partial [Pterocles burchelli]|nr:HSF5 protein [Pterocles burchelli]
PAGINPCHFPGKLWWLAHSPLFRSIRWDDHGEVLLVDKPLFKRELLGVHLDYFKTKNFSSFIRQLNLYGFHKLPQPASGKAGPDHGVGAGSGFGEPLLRYHNPNFRRDRPDLLVHLVRLTSANKAKLAAGKEVTMRPASRAPV